MKKYFFVFATMIFGISLAQADLPSEKALQAQIATLQKAEQTDATKATLKTLQDTQSLLAQIAKQKADNEALNSEIEHSKASLKKSQDNLTKLKNSTVTVPSFEHISLDDLQGLLSAKQDALNNLQTEMASLNGKLVIQNAVPDKAQTALSNNVTHKQAINSALLGANVSDEQKVNFTTELALLDLQNSYNQTLLRGDRKSVV